MIMARSIILSLAVLHFGSALVTGQGIKDVAKYQVVRGTGKCASSGRIDTGVKCAEAFTNFAEMHGYAYSAGSSTPGQGSTSQCRAKVDDSTKTVTATYKEDASGGPNAETHVACTPCGAGRRMLGDENTDYECKAAADSFEAGKARCPVGQVYDNNACHEVTTICPTEFVPYVAENRVTKCAYVGVNPTWKADGGHMFFGDMEAPAGYLLPKAGTVQNTAYMSSKECYDLLLAAAPAMKKWRDLSWASKKLVEFDIPAGTTTGICYAIVTDADEFKGGLSAGPLSGDEYPVMSGCGSECPTKDASGWKCDTCPSAAAEVATSGRCPFGKVEAWKDATNFDCMNEAHPVCEAGYTPIIDAGVANCYFGYMRLREPTPPCPDLHTFTRENGRWKCTRQTGVECLVSDDNTCPDHYSFEKVDSKWKCKPGANAVCLLKNEVCPAHLSFNERNSKCEADANVIVAEEEKIKCYLGKDLVKEGEEYKCDKVDVKCPKGYKQNVADDKIECKAEGGNSGSIHATASFAAMISVVGAVLMRM